MDNLEERLIALETYIANVERELEQVNQVVIDQSSMIDSLKKEIKKLKDQLENMGDLPKFEKPPHY